jgi:excisionase family DNA binding protein
MGKLTYNSTPTSSPADVYRDVNELAQALGVSRLTVYAGLRSGVIPHLRLGRLYILPRSAIAEWLRSAGGKVA